MNKEQRAPYYGLTKVPLPGNEFSEFEVALCAFCRFGECQGDCNEADYSCAHPLWQFRHSDEAERVYEGKDCWGFRPLVTPEVAADIVGIWLRGQNVDWETVPMLVKKKAIIEVKVE